MNVWKLTIKKISNIYGQTHFVFLISVEVIWDNNPYSKVEKDIIVDIFEYCINEIKIVIIFTLLFLKMTIFI